MVRNGLFLFDDSKVSGGPMRTNLKETECPFRADEWRKTAISCQLSGNSYQLSAISHQLSHVDDLYFISIDYCVRQKCCPYGAIMISHISYATDLLPLRGIGIIIWLLDISGH